MSDNQHRHHPARMTWRRWAALLPALAVCALAFGGALGVGPSFAAHPSSKAAGGPKDMLIWAPPGTAGGQQESHANGSSPAIDAYPRTSHHPSHHPSKADPSKPARAPQHTGGQQSHHRRPAVPADSGSGKRVVFDMSAQRVWLVNAGEKAKRTYLVSGSLYDNVHPGTYEVYSKSRHTVGYKQHVTMEYMVRFTHGENAAIGFHAIPVDHNGHKVQTRAELGTPQSDGCIRQAADDAKALWRFAPVGTSVVVVA